MAGESVSHIVNLTGAQFSAEKAPCTKFILVQTGEEGSVDYVVGCAGKPKIIYEYSDLAGTNQISKTEFFYRDSNFPKTPTEIRVTGNL